MNEISTATIDPRWGAEQREYKSYAIVQTLSHYSKVPLAQAECIDLGCGSGGIAFHLAPHVRSIVGIDPEDWARWEEFQQQCPNLRFMQESVEDLSCADASADIVICNQVYEHVPDPQHLIREIYRILKPSGYCYFAGPNLLFPIEPHVFWPFVHWLPRKFSAWLMRFCGSKAILDAYSADYWRLCFWLNQFEVLNAVPHIVRHPTDYGRNSIFWNILSWIPAELLHFLTPISPAFVFILRKPVQ
jgi:2-polyprenyl-3-methyl-5-hydroxy-6-metoxy-1,4-benzoquinol methylase